MSTNRVNLEMDMDAALRELNDLPNAVNDGASDAVKQLTVLAEGAMKETAPEGAGRDKHLRDSIDTKLSRNGMRGNVGARKRASDGTLLAIYVVEGTDPNSYDDDNPPPPMFDWAAAKLGDASLGYAVAQSIANDGHESFPDRFVDESLEIWEDQVEDVAGKNVRDAIGRLMGGGS